MTTQQFIQIAVDNEFQTLYTRNLVKAYLYKALLQPLNNHEIGCMLGVDRKRVGDYLFQMKVYEGVRNNPFLDAKFNDKFDNVKKACEAYAFEQMISKHREALNRSRKSLDVAKVANLNRYNLN